MKVTEQKGAGLRKVLIGLITSKEALADLSGGWDETCSLGAEDADLIANWCVKHYRTYSRAPAKHIEVLFERWHDTRKRDKDVVGKLNDLLSSLSGEYERAKKDVNVALVVDLAGDLIAKAHIKAHIKALEEQVEVGEVRRALDIAEAFRPAAVGGDTTYDAYRDFAALTDAAFEKKAEPLIRYRRGTALAELLNPMLYRGGFFSFVAKEKSGKSMWLLDMLWKAVNQGRKVAFFETGDSDKEDWWSRVMARVVKRPKAAGPYRVPTKITPTVEYADFNAADDLTPEEVKAAGEKATFLKNRLRMSFHSSGTLTVAGIRRQLDRWDRDEEWGREDIIIIDYADLLAPAPEDKKQDKRIWTGEVWKALRSVSLDRASLVVTATQGNRESYKASEMRMDHVSESKDKNGQVTALVGITRTQDEEERGRCRLNYINSRYTGPALGKRVVHVVGCYERAQPAILSSFDKPRED